MSQPSNPSKKESLKKFRMAVATKGHAGLADSVSEHFGKAETFTIINIEENVIKDVQVIENPAALYRHGAGPIVVKMLVDAKVNLVVAAEFGPGASSLLESQGIIKVKTKPKLPVTECVRTVLARQK